MNVYPDNLVICMDEGAESDDICALDWYPQPYNILPKPDAFESKRGHYNNYTNRVN